jgi:hypothetical protein
MVRTKAETSIVPTHLMAVGRKIVCQSANKEGDREGQSSEGGVMPNSKMSITREQIRATRGLIKWSREKLSVVSGVPIRTLARIETGEAQPQAETLKAIRTTFEGAGVNFITGPSVRRAVPKAE